MKNDLNIDPSVLRQIEALTPDQLRTIRRNIQDTGMSDEETREAMVQAIADGYDIEDFLK